MIKFNLKNTKVSSVTAMNEEDSFEKSAFGKSLAATDIRSVLGQMDFSELDAKFFVKFSVKLLLVASIPFGLKVYEIYNITLLEKEKQRVESILSSKRGESAQLQKKIESFDYLKKQAKEYENKKGLLKGLAHARLVIPKFLDQVQSVIPESVWLTGLSVTKNQDKNSITIDGESLNEESVNSFLAHLQDVVQRNTIQFSTQDVKKTGRLVRVRFSIRADL
ncbi:MAG: PilN domain-containing protein [Bdellovibrionales bacterium]|nr:PilN domain-containing protein [Bdellovibrionales bacterium]